MLEPLATPNKVAGVVMHACCGSQSGVGHCSTPAQCRAPPIIRFSPVRAVSFVILTSHIMLSHRHVSCAKNETVQYKLHWSIDLKVPFSTVIMGTMVWVGDNRCCAIVSNGVEI